MLIATNVVAIPRVRFEKLKNSPKARFIFEDRCRVKISFEDDHSITIDGDSTEVFFAKDVIAAYGRGFCVKDCLTLLREGNSLMLLDLKRWQTSKNALTRIKSRLIGEGGKARMTLEQLTGCKLSIRGRKVAAIGDYDDIAAVTDAIIKLIEGKKHSTVYASLERRNRAIKRDQLLGLK